MMPTFRLMLVIKFVTPHHISALYWQSLVKLLDHYITLSLFIVA